MGHLQKHPLSGHLLKDPVTGHLAKGCGGSVINCIEMDCVNCYCCSPEFYKVIISGGGAACAAVNGTWFLSETADATYRHEDSNVIILLELDRPPGDPLYKCHNMRLTATEKATPAQCFQDIATLDVNCEATGTIDGFTWTVCPVGDDPTPDIIEVTFAGVVACSGCWGNEPERFISEDFSINGTYSATKDPLRSCRWLGTAGGEGFVTRYLDFPAACITPNPIGPDFKCGPFDILVDLRDGDIRVLAWCSFGIEDMFSIFGFDGILTLANAVPHCRETHIVPNDRRPCTSLGGQQVWMSTDGTATVNFEP